MLNYEIEPSILAPLARHRAGFVAREDLYKRRGIPFLRTRVLGLPIPFHQNFEEVNLRFYVRHLSHEGWRRGVVFIKELVPRYAIAYIARRFYNENYLAVPMSHHLQKSHGEQSLFVLMALRRGRKFQ